MVHPADFVDAHRRHWKDGELLFDNERWANADQLYGFSAECGLKAAMKDLGMPVNEEGRPVQAEHLEHVQRLWPVFRDFADGRSGRKYVRQLPHKNPFADWSHHNRYASRVHFGRENVTPHRDAARTVRDMVQSAEQDGRA